MFGVFNGWPGRLDGLIRSCARRSGSASRSPKSVKGSSCDPVAHIARALDSRLPPARWKHVRPQPAGTYTDAELRSAVAECESFARVIRTLGRRPSGGMHRHIASRVRAMDLDVGHFTGQSRARGRTGRKGLRRIPLEEILIVDSTFGTAESSARSAHCCWTETGSMRTLWAGTLAGRDSAACPGPHQRR